MNPSTYSRPFKNPEITHPIMTGQFDLPLKKCFIPAFLIVLCFLIILARVHTYEEPLERDLTTYAVIAHEMLEGRELYSDLVDIKPPGVFLTYAAMELTAGYGINSILLLNIIAAIITLIGVYYGGTALCRGRFEGGLWAALCWTIISGNLVFQANQPNIEVILNSCLIWSFVLFVKDDWSSGYRKAIIIGLLIAIASIHKQIAIIALILIGSIFIIIPPPPIKRSQGLGYIIVMWGIVAGIWLGMFSYFAIRGRFEAFYDVVFVYTRFYAGGLIENLLKGVSLEGLFPITLPFILPLLISNILGIAIGFIKRNRLWIYLIVYAISCQIMVSLPGKFFPHYYQLWLPVLAVGTGSAFAELREMIKPKWKWASQVIAIFIITFLLSYQLPLYTLSPSEWSRKKYGDFFVSTNKLAMEIDKLLKPGETFYEWGAESGLYFYSQRRPPTGVVLFFPLIDGPLVQKLSQRVIEDLKKEKPELLIMPPEVPVNHQVIAWLSSQPWQVLQYNADNYFSLYVRGGGSLESRLIEEASLK
ncbi:hypothetical protein OAC89_00375 [Deltaproteobacteria bacterium]|nr:hypothetical protein [Deltaproteobacteria bacterium]